MYGYYDNAWLTFHFKRAAARELEIVLVSGRRHEAMRAYRCVFTDTKHVFFMHGYNYNAWPIFKKKNDAPFTSSVPRRVSSKSFLWPGDDMRLMAAVSDSWMRPGGAVVSCEEGFKGFEGFRVRVLRVLRVLRV